MAGREVDWNEVQGIVSSGYRKKPASRYYLLKIEDVAAARAWLRRERTISYDNDCTESGLSLNIAFTRTGLEKMGLPKDALDTFPWDFRDGMASPLRRRILSDFGPNDPECWKWGGCNPEPHVLVLAYAPSKSKLATLAAALEKRWKAAFQAIDRRQTPADGYLHEDNREHFGFVDGLSQPAIDTSLRSQKRRERGDVDAIIQPGEFILGYVNERGQMPVSPSIACVPESGLAVITNADRSVSGHPPHTVFPRLDFGRNGSFLVYRQLRQDVLAFANLIEYAAGLLGDAQAYRLNDEADFRQLLAAKIIGRWDDGTSLTLAPRSPPPPGGNPRPMNNFGYADEDRYGLRCPIGAHVRRANPRDSLDDDPAEAIHRNKRHRLLRRGRIYGERTFSAEKRGAERPGAARQYRGWHAWDNRKKTEDGEDRGTHFVVINASIESQFEFVQQTWMNTPFFGRLTNELDPLVGMPDDGEKRPRFTIQSAPLNRRFRIDEPLVTVRGGAYFFLPSRSALKFLASDQLIAALQPGRPHNPDNTEQ
jgi:deferrochelatase/peroxidase EfeB